MSSPADQQPASGDQPVHDRDLTADDRDRTADAHDQASQARDHRSDARDERAEERERTQPYDPTAAADRAGAKRDRQGSANDRKHAEHDRVAAATDRALSARERDALLVDGLTGVHRREAGLLELEREILKARRTGHAFVLAFLDVDGLKTTNDTAGHAAGDELLRRVVESVRDVLRDYDLIVRYGGDEFLVGVMDLPATEAAVRFEAANARLAVDQGASMSVGLAELAPADSLADLIARADTAMYEARQGRARP